MTIRILLILLMAIPVFGQRFTKEVQSIADMQALSPTDIHKAVLVRDPDRGGIFYVTNTVSSTNTGTRFASGTAGYSWQRIYDGAVNVKWFGAKGDGTTDDYTAFVNTISATAEGQIISIPKGTYKLQHPTATQNAISIQKNLSLVGEPGTVLQWETATVGSNRVLFRLDATDKTVLFKDFKLIGPTTTNAVEYRAVHVLTNQVVTFDGIVASGNIDNFCKTEPVDSFGEIEVRVLNSDITCGHNVALGLPNFLIQDSNTLHVVSSKFENTTVPDSLNFGYHFYIYRDVNFSFSDCDFGETKGFAIANHGGTTLNRQFASVVNCRFNGTYNSGFGTFSAIEVDGSTETSIIGCKFYGSGKSIVNRNDVIIDSCEFYAPSASQVTALDIADEGANARISNSKFQNAAISVQDTDNATRSHVQIIGSRFNITSDSAAITQYRPISRMVVDGCVFEGSGPITDGYVVGRLGDLDVRNCVFENSATVRGIRVLNGVTGVVNLNSFENWFNHTNAIGFASAISLGTNNIIPRRGVSPTVVASAASVYLDLNYDTYLVSGTTPIDSVLINDTALYVKGNIGPYKIIPTGAWNFSGSGNVTGSIRPRTVNKPLSIQLFKDISTEWFEMTPDTFDTVTATKFSGIGATITASDPVVDITQTWNNGAVVFTALKVNVTNTASSASSLLFDFQVAGSSQASLTRGGSLTVANGITASGASGINAASTASLGFTSRSLFRSPANGRINLLNNAETDFSRLNFGLDAKSTNAAIAQTSGTRPSLTVVATDGTSPADLLVTGNFNPTNTVIFAPSGIQTISAGTAILANARNLKTVSNGGAVTVTATPTIADGTDGQIISIIGTDDANPITLQDESSLAGSNLELGAATRALGRGDILVLRMETSSPPCWFEESFVNN